jgi:hypothetical protein
LSVFLEGAMRLGNERGEGKAANFISLLLLLAVIYAAFKATPVYYSNYNFKDKMVEVARTPTNVKDEQILEMLMKQVKEEELYEFIGPKNFKISTTQNNRRIWCDYDREVEFLPGYKKNVHFALEVDQPLVW